MASAKYGLTLILLTLSGLQNTDCKSMVKLSGAAGSWKTSSSLAWVTPPKDGSIPPDAIYIGQEESGGGLNGGPVWCRGQWHNTWVAGEHQPGKEDCTIAFLGTVFEVTEYDILVSLGGSARVKWVPWDKIMAKPEKSVMTPHTLLAVAYEGVNGTIHTGNLGRDNIDRTANMLDRNSLEAYSLSKVLVLTEVEPIRYTLTDIQLDTLLDTQKDSVEVLANTLLTNEEDDNSITSAQATFTVTEKQYWGRIKGTVVALPTKIYQPSGESLDISWGVEAILERVDISDLKKNLPPGTGVNATVIGKMVHYEAPYFGAIRAFYEDDFSKTWRINSFHSHDKMKIIVAQYGSPFYLRNGSVVPDFPPSSQLLFELTTTTTTTSTTTTSTTTTTTTTTTPPPTTTTEKELQQTKFVDYETPGEIQMKPQAGSLSKDENLTEEYGGEVVTSASTSSSSSQVHSSSSTVLKALAGILTSIYMRYFFSLRLYDE